MPDRRNPVRLWAVVFWLAAWQMAAGLLGQKLLLPSPAAVLLCLGRLSLTAGFWMSVLRSAGRIYLGFFLGCLCGCVLAVPAYRFQRVRELLALPVTVIKAVPVASFVILALVWLNSRSLVPFITFLMVFPPMYLHVLAGIGQTDPQLLELARVFRVPVLRQMRQLWLPAILPGFRTAVSLSAGLCWKAGTAAEIIGLPAGTVGERLYKAKVYFETPELFAWTVTVVAVSLLAERILLALAALADRCLTGRGKHL